MDSGGNLLLFDHAAGFAARWGVVNDLFFPLLALGWLVSVAAQAFSYRRASGARRQQLKWLLAGSVLAGTSLAVATGHPFGHALFGKILAVVAATGILAIPAGMGVAILRYRLCPAHKYRSENLVPPVNSE